jgi:hypothetical protein
MKRTLDLLVPPPGHGDVVAHRGLVQLVAELGVGGVADRSAMAGVLGLARGVWPGRSSGAVPGPAVGRGDGPLFDG